MSGKTKVGHLKMASARFTVEQVSAMLEEESDAESELDQDKSDLDVEVKHFFYEAVVSENE